MMKTLMVTAVAVLTLTACKKDGTTVVELRTQCNRCSVDLTADGTTEHYEVIGSNVRTFTADEGAEVSCQVCWLPTDQYLVVAPGDTVFFDQVESSMMAMFIVKGEQTQLGGNGTFVGDTCFTADATVPEDN